MAKRATTVPGETAITRLNTTGKLVVANVRADRFTKAKRDIFLATLADTCNVKASCKAAKISDTSIYYNRVHDPEFRREWQDALREGYSRLELAMLDRAINGRPKPVYYAGNKIDTIAAYSDGLGMQLLAAYRAATMVGAAGNVDAGEVAEARATIERRVKAIKLKAARAAQIADGDSHG